MTADEIHRRTAAFGLPAMNERHASALAEEVTRLQLAAQTAAARHDLLWCAPADFDTMLARLRQA